MYQYLNIIWLIFALSLSSTTVVGQIKVSGVIKDASSGESLIGAAVYVKDKPNNGTVTDIDGYYTLTVDSEADILVYSYTGYASQERIVGLDRQLNINLVEGELIEDVVIIGYGTVKREDATGSLQSVTSKDFNKGAITGPQQLLAGKVAGVSITTSGDPGGGSSIRIRGESSLTASNDPLIVIDGVPLDNEQISGGRNNLNIVNPNDIESITVLKDASATAIYGNRASAGVILITTKKGNLGDKIGVAYNGNVSIGNISKKVDVLQADEYRALVNELFPDKAELLGSGNTDWQDMIYQTAVSTDHNVSISGGIGQMPYRVSLGYTNANGLLMGDNFNRLTGGINLNPSFLDNRLQVNLGLKAMRNNNDFADRGAIGAASSFDPTQTVLSGNDRFGGYTTWTNSSGNVLPLATANPVALLNLVQDESTVNRYITNATIDYRFARIPALRANLNLAYDKSASAGFKFIDTIAAFNPLGTNNTYTQDKENQLLEFYLNYKKDIKKHTVDFLTGYSWQRIGYASSNIDSNVVKTVFNTRSDARELYLISLFGRANYDWDDKALFTITVRSDGTSRFGPKNRWGLFPAAAFAYKLIDNSAYALNKLKVRLGYGITGQQDIGGNYYAYLGTYIESEPNAAYLFGQDFINTIRANGYDEAIRWETTTTYNAGFDFGLIKNKVYGSVDYYHRSTEDLLINGVSLAAGTNLSNVLDTNIGNMNNQGIEVNLNFIPIDKEKLSWNFNINGAYNRNEITRLRATDNENFIGILTGGIAGGVGSNIQINTVGYTPYSFYVFEQEYDEAGNIIPGSYVDRNEDGVVNEQDKYRVFQRQPDYTFGLASNLTLGNLEFSFAGRSYIGNYMYHNVQTDMGWLNRITNNTGSLTNIHRSAVTNDIKLQSQATFSDHFLENASFFRMDHITLGYNLAPLLKHNIRVYATVQNPFIITNYSGLDPEEFSGIDNNLYPRPRNYVFGLSANF